jgi:hypothetical protein
MSKKVWRTPEVKRIAAGSAEFGPRSTLSDAGNNRRS